MGDELPTVLIGELYLGAGQKKEAGAYISEAVDVLQKRSLAQVEAGADAITLNVSAAGVDEVELLPRAIQALMATVDVPLGFDSANARALEAALKIYQGKPLINGVTGDEGSLAAILPLAKKYKAVVICQARDSTQFPDTPDQRVAIARRILERAETTGIPPEDVLIDCITFSPAVQKYAGTVSFETIRRVNAELGVNTAIVDGHVTYGLPAPDFLNYAFVAMSICCGVSCLLVDVTKVRTAVLAADVMVARDQRSTRYVRAYRQMSKDK